MRRSKMEMHLDILRILAQKGPLKLTHIMYKANVNCSVLKEYLDFLIKEDLIKEKILKKERIVYELTEKGLKVIKYFRELQVMLPIDEENRERIPSILY
ncbi:MAG: winged helix-turn-helix domain-containing protein [Candidatus Bathyarchaeota archaeon]|jgi:predicted transcriptional regulator